LKELLKFVSTRSTKSSGYTRVDQEINLRDVYFRNSW